MQNFGMNFEILFKLSIMSSQLLSEFVFVARLGSASLKFVQKHEEGQGNSWKAYITQYCATVCFRWCKVLEWKYWHFYFFHHLIIISFHLNKIFHIKCFGFLFFRYFCFLWALEFWILGFKILNPWIEDCKS